MVTEGEEGEIGLVAKGADRMKSDQLAGRRSPMARGQLIRMKDEAHGISKDQYE